MVLNPFPEYLRWLRDLETATRVHSTGASSQFDPTDYGDHGPPQPDLGPPGPSIDEDMSSIEGKLLSEAECLVISGLILGADMGEVVGQKPWVGC